MINNLTFDVTTQQPWFGTSVTGFFDSLKEIIR